MTRVRFVVLAWLCLAAMIAYVQRNSIAVAESTIREDLGMTKGQMGLVLSAFFAAYALCQIPSGWLVDRWGSRRTLTLFVLAFSAFSGLAALTNGYVSLMCARLGMGMAQAGIFPASTHTIGKWFPRSAWAMSSGILGAFMQFGSVLGMNLTGLLLGPAGMSWRWLCVLYAWPGIVWSVWFFNGFRERPELHLGVGEAERRLIDARPSAAPDVPSADPPDTTPWLMMLASFPLWCICGQQFCRAAAAAFFQSWFPTYLQETRGVSIGESGLLNSWPPLATALGSILGGFLSDALLRLTGRRRLGRQWLAAISTLACAGLIFPAFFIQNARGAVLLISAASFLAGIAGPCAYSITIDMGGRHVASVFSVMNMWGNIGTTAFPLVVPLLLRWTGDWNLVLFLFAALYVVSAACWLAFSADRAIFDAKRR